jgi:CDP-diacylglycerol--serine O-phosphatidyltransferase
MKRHIPNLLTLLNVFSGCVAVVFAVLNQFEMAALFVFLGILFDFFDGLAARVLNVQGELGLQLDSLADMITSGLVPGVVMFRLLGMSMNAGWNMEMSMEPGDLMHLSDRGVSLLPFAGFLFTLAVNSDAVDKRGGDHAHPRHHLT